MSPFIFYPLLKATKCPKTILKEHQMGGRQCKNCCHTIQPIIVPILKDLDIIIFPESTITTGMTIRDRSDIVNYTTNVPHPDDHIKPCEDTSGTYQMFFKLISCTAKTRQTYVVVNLIEQSPCLGAKCSNDHLDFYNTNVVFDRDGYVFAR
jgi:Carbon-nitrogen hydrolase